MTRARRSRTSSLSSLADADAAKAQSSHKYVKRLHDAFGQ